MTQVSERRISLVEIKSLVEIYLSQVNQTFLNAVFTSSKRNKSEHNL